MAAPALDGFAPLQGAISQAVSWKQYLNAHRDELGSRRVEDVAASLENIVWFGVKLGELLPFTWRLTFDNLFRPSEEAWTTVKEFEAIRQDIRRLFFTAREAMEMTRQVAESLQALTGRRPAGMDQLLGAIENARQLEETVFHDWPSFMEPLETVGVALLVHESLAAALGITVEQAQQKMDARRRELNSKPE